jgi:hypothetical protein
MTPRSTLLMDASSIVGPHLANQLGSALALAEQGHTIGTQYLQPDSLIRHWVASIGVLGGRSEIDHQMLERMIDKIKAGASLPLVVSHLEGPISQPVQDGFIAGYPVRIWLEEPVIMVQGVFSDTRLGRQAYDAIVQDRHQNGQPRIGVSIAYWETGMPRHLALTRIPKARETTIAAWTSLNRQSMWKSI